MNRPKVIKDKECAAYIEWLEKQHSDMVSSQYYSTYCAIRKQIDSWNKQLMDANIDLFGDKENKEFDRAFKYFVESSDLLEAVEKLKGKMSPDEKLEAEKASFEKGAGTAEWLAMNT